MNEQQTIEQIEAELRAANDRSKKLHGLIQQADNDLKLWRKELDELCGGMYRTGLVKRLEAKLQHAKQVASDRVALPVVWAKRSTWSDDPKIVDKVTAKLIFIRGVGSRSSARYYKNGESCSGYSDERIDIRKTFNVDADVLPDDFTLKS